MSLELFHTNEYKHIIQTHICNTLAFLLQNGKAFSIAAELRHCSFTPELPGKIMDGFDEVVLFVMAGYTFESAHLDEDFFYFEAGFGSEGFGSRVSVPLLAVKQVFVDEYPIAINISEPVRKQAAQSTNDHSMEALLKNPENQKLLKKQKKS